MGSHSGGRASAGTSTTGACAVDAGSGGPSGAGGAAVAKEGVAADNLELGELEQLTITNDNESSYDVSTIFCIH